MFLLAPLIKKQSKLKIMANELMKLDFNAEQIKLIKSQIAPKATDDELKLFIYQAKRTGLDPLARQIYAIHRRTKDMTGNWVDKMTIQTSIDGFRVVAERSGDYAGQDEPVFVEQDGKIICCKVTVYRFKGDQRYPAAVGVAYWDEYKQTDKDGKVSGLWSKMPHVMISKVAEALALRKAYPQDLSGLYTGDEMEQDQQPVKPVITKVLFDKAIQRLKSGEMEVYAKTLDAFTLNSDQLTELETVFAEQNLQTA